MKKIGLLPKIIIAIAIGIGIGNFAPEWFVRIFATINMIFGELLNFTIPLIILGLVTIAIADIGTAAKRMLIITVCLAYGFTLFSGSLSFIISDMLFPSLIDSSKTASLDSSATVSPYISLSVPAAMGVMTALVLSFVLGLGLAGTKSKALYDVAHDFQEIIVKMIAAVIVPLLPLYIFGIFLIMTYVGQVSGVLVVFIKIIGVIFALHVFILILQFIIAGLVAKKNPFKMLWNMMPAYFTALGTQSSAATIPVTLEQVKKNGVTDNTAGFVVPLCATIHLSGSTLKIVACAIALMMMQGMEYTAGMMIQFIFVLGITMIAAPGVPGGAIMASLGVLQSILGFDEQAQALMIALYIAMDSFGTACNVTGDGAISLIVDSIQKKNKEKQEK